MNPKTTIGLVAALVLAAAGVWWVQSSPKKLGGETEKKEPKALFDKPLEELSGFEIVKTGEGKSFVFTMDNGKWQMTSPIKGPGQHFTVNADAEKIKGLKYTKAFAKVDPERPSEKVASLDNPPRIVRLTTKSGQTHTVKIG